MSDFPTAGAAQMAAINPATSAADLAQIAQQYPALQATVAHHPNTYDGLLDWIATYGGAQAVQAVAARRAGGITTAPVLPASPPADPPPVVVTAASPQATTVQPSKAKTKMGGVVFLLLGVVVFVVCSIIQGAGGSSMFSTRYARPDSIVLDILMNITFWPGWVVSVLLVLGGIVSMLPDKAQ